MILPAPDQRRLARAFRLFWSNERYPWKLPVSSPFGPRVNPVTGDAHDHTGIDIPAPYGTPVLALWDGRVSRVDRDGIGKGQVNGNAVHLAAGDWRISYLHLSGVAVRAGQRVARGAPLGMVGSSGRSTGPHLHLQVSVRGQVIDPAILYPSNLLMER